MMAARERPVFVVFEGLDGTGKSTCARRTAERLGARLLTTPSVAVRRFRDELVRDLGQSQEAQQLFYMATVFAASNNVRDLLAVGTSVVLDRYFLSTQAYAEFRGSRLSLDELQRLLLPADLTVLLEAPLGVRRARVRVRGGSTADGETLTEDADAFLRRAHDSRLDLAVVGRVLRQESATTEPDEVARRVLEALRCRAHSGD